MIRFKALTKPLSVISSQLYTHSPHTLRARSSWWARAHRRRLHGGDGTRRRRRGGSGDRRRGGGGAARWRARIRTRHFPLPHTEVEMILPKGSKDSATT